MKSGPKSSFFGLADFLGDFQLLFLFETNPSTNTNYVLSNTKKYYHDYDYFASAFALALPCLSIAVYFLLSHDPFRAAYLQKEVN